MHTVRPLHDVQRLGRHRDRRQHGLGLTIVAAVENLPPLGQGPQHFFIKPLPVHVAAGLRQSLRRPLFRPQEKIVHVEHIAVVNPRQKGRQGGLSAGAAALDGDGHPVPLHPLLVDGRQQGQEPDEFATDDPIGRAVHPPEALRMVTGGEARPAPFFHSHRRFLQRKREPARFRQGQQRRQLFLQGCRIARRRLR